MWNSSLYTCLIIITLSLSINSYSYTSIAQEIGALELSIEGYDGSADLNAVIFDSDLNILENRTIDAPDFTFDNLIVGDLYSILVKYKGIEYQDTLSIESSTQQFTIQVYEPTISDENIIVSTHQIFVDKGPNYLNITEFLVFNNVGETLVNGTDLKIALPDGSRNFIWDQDCCFKSSDFGFFFQPTEPIFPNPCFKVLL
jgi:hypothetical protein